MYLYFQTGYCYFLVTDNIEELFCWYIATNFVNVTHVLLFYYFASLLERWSRINDPKADWDVF